jgi:hypothetical protein
LGTEVKKQQLTQDSYGETISQFTNITLSQIDDDFGAGRLRNEYAYTIMTMHFIDIQLFGQNPDKRSDIPNEAYSNLLNQITALKQKLPQTKSNQKTRAIYDGSINLINRYYNSSSSNKQPNLENLFLNLRLNSLDLRTIRGTDNSYYYNYAFAISSFLQHRSAGQSLMSEIEDSLTPTQSNIDYEGQYVSKIASCMVQPTKVVIDKTKTIQAIKQWTMWSYLNNSSQKFENLAFFRSLYISSQWINNTAQTSKLLGVSQVTSQQQEAINAWYKELLGLVNGWKTTLIINNQSNATQILKQLESETNPYKKQYLLLKLYEILLDANKSKDALDVLRCGAEIYHNTYAYYVLGMMQLSQYQSMTVKVQKSSKGIALLKQWWSYLYSAQVMENYHPFLNKDQLDSLQENLKFIVEELQLTTSQTQTLFNQMNTQIMKSITIK